MRQISQLSTPCFLLDLDIVEHNIAQMAELCKSSGKMLWPMVKTHKSAAIAGKQKKYGAAGFLAGTIDEAECLAEHGHTDIMLAYPVAAAENIARVINLVRKAHIILSFDGAAAAAQWEQALAEEALVLEYLIIIDSGLHRFGVLPDNVLALAQELSSFTHLTLKGIATHPGHVYGKNSAEGVAEAAQEEIAALEQAAQLLTAAGFRSDIVAAGSTPTAPLAARSKVITTLRPGNYVFYDAIQVALGIASIEQCALTVQATIIANPAEGLFLIDAGSKCFGLDKGAHGTALLNGFGLVKGHPELLVEGLSEEVGKVRIMGSTCLQVGDKVEIIPNHACSACNMTSFLLGHRQGIVEKVITVDARGGTTNRI